MKQVIIALALALAVSTPTEAFQCPSSSTNDHRRVHSSLHVGNDVENESITDRRAVLNNIITGGLTIAVALPSIANAEGFAGMDEMAPVPRESYKKLPCGVTYADLRVGSGDTADAGKKVNVQWVLRKSNGYFVDSSDVSGGVPFIFTIGEKGAAIEGVDEGLRGMKVGGTRRLLIPPRLAYVEGLDDGKPGPLPAGFGPRTQMKRVQQAAARTDVPGEFIFLEMQLTKVR